MRPSGIAGLILRSSANARTACATEIDERRQVRSRYSYQLRDVICGSDYGFHFADYRKKDCPVEQSIVEFLFKIKSKIIKRQGFEIKFPCEKKRQMDN